MPNPLAFRSHERAFLGKVGSGGSRDKKIAKPANGNAMMSAAKICLGGAKWPFSTPSP
jgi:hypothetical protein